MKGVFVTGTGTGVGKTVVCGLLAGFLRARGMRVTTQKWVETGVTDGPSDIDVHRSLMGDPGPGPEPPPADRCPYRFSLPASPHLAAAREGRRVDPAVIEAAYRRLAETHDVVLVEGGRLPRSALGGTVDRRSRRADRPSVLVVAGNRLGCVNDALLTVEAVRRRGVPLDGARLQPPPGRRGRDAGGVLADNPRIVAAITRAPVLGEVPLLSDPARGAEAFAPWGGRFSNGGGRPDGPKSLLLKDLRQKLASVHPDEHPCDGTADADRPRGRALPLRRGREPVLRRDLGAGGASSTGTGTRGSGRR